MFLKYNWPGLLWLLVILALTGFPGNYFPSVTSFWYWLGPDKIVHLFIFGILTYLLLRGFHKQSRFRNLQSHYIIYALIIGIIFGALTEVMQRYIFIGRNANVYDFLANLSGCIIGLIAYYLINRKLSKNIRILDN